MDAFTYFSRYDKLDLYVPEVSDTKDFYLRLDIYIYIGKLLRARRRKNFLRSPSVRAVDYKDSPDLKKKFVHGYPIIRTAEITF